MASIWDQLEAELRAGPQLRAAPGNRAQTAIRSAISRVSDAVAASPAAAQQIENNLLDVGQFLSGLWAPGGAKGAGLVLSPRNVPKLRAAMEAALGSQARTPENIALAWAKAKYPKLTSIPDYARISRSSEILGDYLPETNTVRISMKDPSLFGSRKTPEFVDTIMHETQHARQAYRRRPLEIRDLDGEIHISPEDLDKARAWDNSYAAYEKEADLAARKMLERGDSPERAHAMRYELYRQNPYERAAWRAGETARNTFQNFQRFDTASRPGQRSRLLDRVRDWMDQFLGGVR